MRTIHRIGFSFKTGKTNVSFAVGKLRKRNRLRLWRKIRGKKSPKITRGSCRRDCRGSNVVLGLNFFRFPGDVTAMFFPLSRTTRKTNATLLQVDRTQKPRGSGGSVLIAFKKKIRQRDNHRSGRGRLFFRTNNSCTTNGSSFSVSKFLIYPLCYYTSPGLGKSLETSTSLLKNVEIFP